MKIFLIIMIIFLLIILSIYFSLSVVIFKKTFYRGEDPLYTEENLKNTKYEKYSKELLEHIKYMQSLEYENEEIISFDKLKLTAKYYDRHSENLVVMVHGYRANPFNNFNISARSFLEHDYNVLMINQRGHSSSEGKYITFGCLEYKDVLKWIEYANNKFHPKNIVLYGVSMGCATIANCSNKDLPSNVKLLVLDCGFANTKEEICYILKKKKHLPSKLFMPMLNIYSIIFAKTSLKMNPMQSLKESKLPCFFLHGEMDQTVPFNHGVRNYESCANEKEAYFPKNVDHTLCYLDNTIEVEKRLFKFIERYL